MDELEPVGLGALHAQFERLKARLAQEGLFDEARKRPLPPFPRCIGVVTSPVGAVLRDILNVLRRRYPPVEVFLSPTPVQGADAPPRANLDAVFQVPWREKAALPFVVTLEPVEGERLGRALAEIAGRPFHVEPPLALPMVP